MLVLEGFGNIVELPTHEKLAVLLTERTKLIEENKLLKLETDNLIETSNNIDKYECDLQALKLVNDKLTNEIIQLKNQVTNLEEINKENDLILVENTKFKQELAKLKSNTNEVKKLVKSAQTSIDYEDSEENMAIIEASKFEIAKLKEDNINLKLEMDKLYDEIGQFELENRQLKDENKKSIIEMENLNNLVLNTKKTEMAKTTNSSKEQLNEIKKLKQEILDLNNELDDLVQYKDNYENLKLDYDKLNATIQLNSEKLQTAMINKQKPGTQPEPEPVKNKAQLELEWIKNENEKLLLELEKVQAKLDEKNQKFNELKQQIATKDEQMNEFIDKYEKRQTTDDDSLKLQKRILELEHELTKEKEDCVIEMESNEERQKDLLKRNDQLWSQSNKMENNYKEAMDIIRQQTERIRNLEIKINELEKSILDLDDLLKQEKQINENLYSKNEILELKLTDSLNQLEESEQMNSKLTKENLADNEKNELKISQLQNDLTNLNAKLKDTETFNQNLKFEIDSLNKEKTFIISQNESTHQKVLQDYFSLQEKYTGVNYQFNKLSKDNQQIELAIKEKEALLNQIESEKNELNLNLKQESRDKSDLIDKLKNSELTISKVIVYLFKFSVCMLKKS